MGGDILAVEVSAKNKLNLDKLIEAILLQAEILDLKANPNRAAEGIVIEAKLDIGRGPVATVLMRRGTLRVGDIFVSGAEWGKVRAILDDKGARLDMALPGMPVEVLGANGAPVAGDDFMAVDSEGRAREIADYRQRRQRQAFAMAGKSNMEQLFSSMGTSQATNVPFIIKADVHGSLEAIKASLEKLSTEEVAVQILHTGVGSITESDVGLAKATKALVVGFNVRANPQAREAAKRDGTEIRYYSIIYNVIDDVKALLSGMLSPDVKEEFIGYAEIRQVFDVSKSGKVAGCFVTEGIIKRGCKVRLLRDNVVIHEGSLKTLKRFKDEVKDVKAGYECGMAFENYQDIREKDMIECFEIVETARTLA
jgi:translation initiation factor IF-2